MIMLVKMVIMRMVMIDDYDDGDGDVSVDDHDDDLDHNRHDDDGDYDHDDDDNDAHD